MKKGFIVLAVVGLFFSGCSYSLQPTPKESLKNAQVSIYVDDTASQYRKEAYKKAFVELLNTQGIRTYYAYDYQNCSYQKKYYKFGNRIDFKRFLVSFGHDFFIQCEKSHWLAAKDMPSHIEFEAILLDDDKIEIKTNGTYEDLMQKYVALQSLGTNKDLAQKLLVYGYLNTMINHEAAKQKRLIIELYPSFVDVKAQLEDALQKRGFKIVSAAFEADRIVYIENLAALPLNYSGGLHQFYKKNFKQLMQTDLEHIQRINEHKIEEVGYNQKHHYDGTILATHTGMLGSILGGGSRQQAGELGLIIFATGLLLNFLEADPYEKFYVAYKLIVKNTKSNLLSNDPTQKYMYRPVIYHTEILTWGSNQLLSDKIFSDDGVFSLKTDMAQMIEFDKKFTSDFIFLPYENFN